VIRGRFLRAFLAAASLALAACGGRKEPPPTEQPQPVKGELPVAQTPVSSIYDEKPGTLYERPAPTPTVSPAPAPTARPTRKKR
jgi:hypothetical protein